jgi:GTP cyclohydrolase I
MLEDVQNLPDHRHIAIDDVGISGISYPVAVWDRDQGKQETIGAVSMSVSLHPDVKGAHLSRFVEVLHQHAGDISPRTIPAILQHLRGHLHADHARLEISFPYFVRRAAPVTGMVALMDYQCCLSGATDSSITEVCMQVRVPVTSVCPCSKAISDYGAHNQRSHITIRACLSRSDEGEPASVWVEELVEIAEASASSPVFPLLKRADERHVTMRAYDHPVFVEDMARSVAAAMQHDQRIAWFTVEAASEESIHNHAAFARIQSLRAPGRSPQLLALDT